MNKVKLEQNMKIVYELTQDVETGGFDEFLKSHINESFVDGNKNAINEQQFLDKEFDKILEKMETINDWSDDYDSIMDFFEITQDEITDEHCEYESLHNQADWIFNCMDCLVIDWVDEHPIMAIILRKRCEKKSEEWLEECRQMDVFSNMGK